MLNMLNIAAEIEIQIIMCLFSYYLF